LGQREAVSFDGLPGVEYSPLWKRNQTLRRQVSQPLLESKDRLPLAALVLAVALGLRPNAAEAGRTRADHI
jgi:hypothetical protein